MATVSAQLAHAAETVSTGLKFIQPLAAAVPTGQTAGLPATSADILRRKLEQDPVERARPNKRRGFTFGAMGGGLAKTLDGVKLLGWQGPGADHRSSFDIPVEINGLGLQFEDQRTYGFKRADQAFSHSNTVGVRFRYRF